jgi:hypothetical protein
MRRTLGQRIGTVLLWAMTVGSLSTLGMVCPNGVALAAADEYDVTAIEPFTGRDYSKA